MQDTLREIFRPSPTNVLLAVAFTLVAHVYLTEEAVRRATGRELAGTDDFWLSNFVNALPYLRTDNILLKFLTFFLLGYAVVWVISTVVGVGDRVQAAAAKRLRRTR